MNKYSYLAVIAVVFYFLNSFFLSSGGIGYDSLSYFGIASDLPALKANLFPLGYPVLIRIFHFVFQDYFWAVKMLNITMVVIILLFSHFKRFYFRETVLLFTGKAMFFSLNLAVSEGPFLFFTYFLMFLLHQRFHEKICSRKFIVFTTLILVALFTVRYSGIYIYMGIGAFWLMVKLLNRKLDSERDLFWVLVFAGIGILCYLGFNYYTYSSFTGENLRGAPAHYFPIYILRDLLGVTNVVDPFIGLKPASNSWVSIGFQLLIMVLDFFLLGYFVKLYRRKKDALIVDFYWLLWTVAIFYTVTLFISGLVQQIEEMNVRMLAAANLIFFFSFLLIYFKNLKSDRLIFGVGCFFLFFLMAYHLKNPVYYFKNRDQIKPQMSKFKDRKYSFNDEKDGPGLITVYHIPLINKELRYKHTQNQLGDVKISVAGTINPQIKWLKYDTIKDKSQVLYTSELKLKR